jgi:putative peptide zinc metalloprotease protein
MSGGPRLRADLVLVEQTYRGEQSFIVKDPTTRKYFRFRPVEIAVMQAFDGERTAAQAAAALVEQGIGVSVATVGRFAAKLKGMGLFESTLQERSVLLMERLRAQRRNRLDQSPLRGDFLRLRWSLGDPDKFMDRTIPYVRFCFTRGFLVASVVLFLLHLLVLVDKWPEYVGALSDLYLFRASAADYALFWLVAIVIIVAHELAHGYTCKHYGGKVHEIGAMLFYFEPAFFCNVNDAWTFPERKARLWVTAAGSWIELVLASIAAIVWWLAAPGTLTSDVALTTLLIAGLATMFVNLNPLLPLDGYYALLDWLEVSNLRQRAFAHLRWTINTRWLGLDQPMPPADERERRIFLVYGTLAALYTASIFLLIGSMVFGWLSRTFGALGMLALVAAVWMMSRNARRDFGRDLVEAWRAWRARRAGSRGTGRRNARYAFGALAAIGLVGLVPWRITVTGPFVVAPSASGVLVAPDSGLVFEVLVREGDLVPAGAPLAVIRNLELERGAVAAARAVDSLAMREAQARAGGREGEAARISTHRRAEAARLAGLRDRVATLAVRAAVAGVVLTPRPEDLTGSMVSLGDTLLRLGGQDGVEARVALTGAGAPLAREGQPVRLVAHADPSVRLTAVVTGVSASAVPGGALESRVRLVRAAALRPGMTGEASITIRRTNAWGALWWAIRSRIRTDVLL